MYEGKDNFLKFLTLSFFFVWGLTPSDDPKESEAIALAVNWKKNLYHCRDMESVRAPLGNKGPRRMDKSASTSSLVNIIAKARTRSIGSPSKH